MPFGMGSHTGGKNPASCQAWSLTAGSLQGPDAVLTVAAFHEQGREIGRLHFSLGRISQKWASAARQYDTLPHQPEADFQWTSLLIAALWRYTKSLWYYRNEIVHGATVEEQAQCRLAALQNRIIDYTEFQNNDHLVLQRHQNLFTAKTADECISASYDTMSAWLCSGEEAIQVVQQHAAALGEASQSFFPGSDPDKDPSTDTDSTYTMSSTLPTATMSFTSTEALTHSTMSSTALSASVNTHIHYGCDSLSNSSADSGLDTAHLTITTRNFLEVDSDSNTIDSFDSTKSEDSTTLQSSGLSKNPNNSRDYP
jgi:hypothetical protein